MADVKFTVRSSLKKIISELMMVKAVADETQKSVKGAGKAIGDEMGKAKEQGADAIGTFKLGADGVGEGIKRNTKQTETMFSSLRSMSRRIADQIRGDFKSLISINAIGDAMKLSSQFRSAISESVELSDTIRRLGGIFGVAQNQFAGFQKRLTEGMGEIGLSSDVAARTLEALSKTPVRGQENVLGYSKAAGQLAGIGGEKGQEGQIASGIAGVIQSRSGNVNDMSQVTAIAEALRKVFNQTGAKPTDTLAMMRQLFTAMPKELRAAISTSGLTSLAAAAAVGGPGSTKFLEKYLGQSDLERKQFNERGGAGVVGDQGIDVEKFKLFAKSIMGLIAGDPRAGAKTLGLNDEEAEGFVRLAENLDKVKEAQDAIARSTGDLATQYRATIGLADAFKASINRVKSAFAGPIAGATQGGTSFLANAAQSDAGSAAVTSAAAIVAALLAGGGVRGLGKNLLGTAARKEGAEGLLGQNTVPVYVVNASEIGGMGGGMGLPPFGAPGGAPGGGGVLNKVGGALGAAGNAVGAGALGWAVGNILGYAAEATTTKQNKYGQKSDILERAMAATSELLGIIATGGGAGDARKRYDDTYGDGATDADGVPVKKSQPFPGRTLGPQGSRPSAVTPASPGGGAPIPTSPQKVIIEMNTPQLKASVQPTRGATN